MEIIVISIILGLIFIALIIMLIIGYKANRKLFSQRFVPDKLVKYYTSEEFGLSKEAIEFKCDKDILRGYIHYYDNIPLIEDRIVIHCHGMWSCLRSYIQDVEYLCRNGLKVISFDYTGTDSSDGKNLKGFGQSIKCVDACIKYVKEKFKDKKIYVVGHSWGGFAAVNSIKYHNDIAGIAAISPFLSIKKLISGMNYKLNTLTGLAMTMVDSFYCGSYSYCNAIKSLKNYNGKVMIIHSKDDNTVSYTANTKLLEKEYNDFNYLIVDGKYHFPHYSYDAVNAFREYNKKLYSLTEEQQIEYKKNVDFHKLGELDSNIMDKIVEMIIE